jgi:hypothetical protein
MNMHEVLGGKEGQIRALAARFKAGNIRVFGSLARGEAGPDSDVDFLVEPGPGCSLVDHVALVQELGVLLGRRVDVVSERSLHPRLRERILAEAKSL